MKRLYIALNIILVFYFYPLNSFAKEFSGCSFFDNQIEIDLTTSFGKLEYNHEKNTEYLSKKTHNPNNTTFGLAEVNKKSEYYLDAEIKSYGGAHCWVPKKLVFFLGYKNPTIYITSDKEEGTCEYDHIKRHEQVHMQVHASILEAFIPVIYTYLTDYSQSLKPIRINTQNDIDTKIKNIQKEYIKKSNEIIKIFNKKSNAAQALIDNVDNYKYESTICR